jgi:photosystem II stability/assembly factor-like uncharacterized protein
MARTNPFRTAVVAVCVLVALATTPVLDAATRGASFGRSSMAGSGAARMQLETVPARVARVVVRPGTHGREAWALGTSTARLPGYATITTGQVVFLKYTTATGWVLKGPPRDAAGKVINPVLASFDLRANGEGWAVGDAGVLLHKATGSDVWQRAAQSGAVTTETLNQVSLSADGGYAAGVGPTILRLTGASWTTDQVPADMATQTTELQSVATVSANEAWIVATGQVSGVDSTSLLIYRRSASGWAAVKTGQAIFDSPPAKSQDGALNRSTEAGVVVADARGAWIGGRMYPRSASSPDGDATPGDTSRGFVIHFDAPKSTFTSYCPDQYSERTPAADLTKTCNEPFPTAPFHVASMSIVPGGDVFAGGLGLFRFSRGGWYREPDAAGYLISISMGSNTEGFVASPGRSLGAGGLIRSNSTTIGHWTASPRSSSIARWAQPQAQLLQSVALAPDGSGRAIAVGGAGSAIVFSGAAWDSINPVTGYALHGVGWGRNGLPWAVGSNGILLHLVNNEWEFIDSPTNAALYSVAFRSGDEGVAVGLGGTILAYERGRWREDSPKDIPSDLYFVMTTPDGYLAVGKNGAVVEGVPGNWKLRSLARALVLRPGAPAAPTFYAAAHFGNKIVIGGQDSALIARNADGSFSLFDAPLQGTVLALAGNGGGLSASLSPNESKFRGEAPAAQRGTIMRYAEGRWTDVGLERRVTLLRDKVDPSRFDDPVYALALNSPTDGWGAGGSPADLKDSVEGQFRSQPTGAIYRVAYGSDPTQPASVAPLDAPKPGISFAAFGESWCGTGLCSSSVGTGTMADDVSLQIRDEINSASLQPGGPKFVLFTGNMRRVGIPEELEQFQNYLKGFRIPVFAAIGNLDRFTGLDASQLTGTSTGSASGSNDYWMSVFGGQRAPWGHADPSGNFTPAGVGATAALGLARTHYAFDYREDGQRRMRVVFVDSSTRSYGTLQQQNPQEDQGTWLSTVLTEASTLRIPAVVVMNQPTFLPSDEHIPNWTADSQQFESTVAGANVSAVITGGPRVNAKDTILGVVPMVVVGGGGAALGRDFQLQQGSPAIEPATKLPTDGYYHAWHLMRLDPNDRPLPVVAQARVFDQSFPIVESLAMHSFYGYQVPAGNTTEITALARGLNGGFSDPEQAKAAYLLHGRTLTKCRYKNQGNGICIAGAATLPRFRFYSEDPSIADFVQRDPLNSSLPRKIGKELFADPDGSEGLLCVFRIGKVGVNAVAGLHRARIEIEGTPGNGRCVDTEVKGRIIVRPPIPPLVEPQQPNEPAREFFRPLRPNQELVVVFPPPPAPVVAPAPPGAPGVGRKEEHEVEYETEKHDDGHSFTALPIGRRARSPAPDAAWPMLGTALMLSFCGAAIASVYRERRLASQREGARLKS